MAGVVTIMARYIQHPVTHKLVPADEYIRPNMDASPIHGDIEPFVSPIDGSVISDRKQLREHNKRHDVVNAAEFSPQWYAKKAKERQDFFDGKLSKEEHRARKQGLYDKIIRAEQGLPY